MKTMGRTLALVLVASTCFAQDVARLEQVVHANVQNKTFMGTVLVARGGDIVLSKGYGQANLEWDVANMPSTKFRLGSVTKQFTAASILLLEERGKLTVEDPVGKHIPDAPAAWDAITIRHLLTHTSGITNFTSMPDYQAMQAAASPVAKTLAAFRDKPLDFTPGEKMAYSNSGYLVLGSIIENISGGSYATFLQENIFTPLGMKDSGYDSNTDVIPRRASGYVSNPKGPVHAGFLHMTIPHAAGALYSTTEDLLRWQQGLFGGKVLSAASLQKMTTPFKNDYALGLVVRTVNGRKVVQHGGGINGFNSFLSYYPDSRVTVAVLANINGPVADQMGLQLGALAHGDATQLTAERKEITVPAATLAKYVGTYQMAPNVLMMITLDDDRLIGQLSGQVKIPLFAESERRFFMKVVDAQLEFFGDAAGAVTHVISYQNGRETKATRISATVAERKEVTLAAAALSAFAGTFELRPGLELVITLDGDRLKAQLTGQPAFPLFAEAPTRFFYKNVDAQLAFEQDSLGKVPAVTLTQGPNIIRALRK